MEPIEAAKAVVSTHEQCVRDGDLDGILENIAEDVVILVEAAPLIEGKAAFREFYSSLLGMGAWDFDHDYHGADVVGDSVILYGVAKGVLTPPGEEPGSFANNFLHVFKEQADGNFRMWRVAFASSGEEDAA